jgi:fructose-bisphosphate aldolase class I
MPSFGGPFAAELVKNANLIAATGKGILAADESTGTIGSRCTVDTNLPLPFLKSHY